MHAPLLYESPSGRVVLLDIPSSISGPPGLVLCSTSPPDTPYHLPEPKRAQEPSKEPPSRSHDGLRHSLLEALEHVRASYCGPYLMPRVLDSGHHSSEELDFCANTYLLQPSGSFLDPLAMDSDMLVSDLSDIFSVPISSKCLVWRSLTLSHPSPPKLFHIPPRASFLLSDIQSSVPAFISISNHLRGFHFIILDPPWPNRSASRSHCYSTFSGLALNDLLLLPISRVLVAGGGRGGQGGLVGIWITNNPRFRKFVLEQLFPRWGLETAGEWVWLKVTSVGEPVFDIESQVRKPYEVLLFGRQQQSGKDIPPPSSKRRRLGEGGSSQRHSPGSGIVGEKDVPAEGGTAGLLSKTILAVPDVHSRKPCVKKLIEPSLPSEYRACEIFGRNLTEGWFTWGDEAIKYNWDNYWR